MKDEHRADDDGFAAAMRQFRAEFLASLPGRLQEAQAGLAACLAEPADTARLRALHLAVHKLVGASGTFGMPALGAAAQAAEDELLALQERGAGQAADFAPLAARIAALEQAARA